MDDRFRLTARAKSWIAGIKDQFKAKPLTAAMPVPELSDPAFKIL